MHAAMLSRYLNAHFVDARTFVQSAGITREVFDGLVAAEAMPGAIYRGWAQGAVWSPIGGWFGEEQPGAPASEWFSPAAIWWARRAAVLAGEGLSYDDTAVALREMFLKAFAMALTTEPLAPLAYPAAYGSEEAARETGLLEWADWINGGYGVCLRRFDARSLIVKAGGAAKVREITASCSRAALSAQERLDLLGIMEQMDAVMLPFAPHQRPKGTPGFWVDTPLARYNMGRIPLVETILPDDDITLRCA